MTSLPQGTLTLVFTDIEGSTRLLDTLGPAYQDALATHRALVRDAFSSHLGIEVDTQGDAFFYVFSHARDALQAATQAQRALLEHHWPQETELRVRMGIHTGEPTKTEEGYVGQDVHLGARICAAAWGGQVLVSSATAALLPQDLVGLSLVPLGEHRLKDIKHPVDLHHLVAEGLRQDFPPPRAVPSAHPTNLPSRLPSLIGRDDDLAQLIDVIARDDVFVVTLVGPGGTGKTSLALALGQQLLFSFSDGVFFVDLSALNDPALVIPAVAQALALKESGGRSLQETVTEHLSKKEMLLILDNLEQVIDSAPEISSLMSSADRLKVVVTSREALRIGGEREFPVAPLSLPRSSDRAEDIAASSAVELFVARAQEARPDFSLTPELSRDVAAVCRRLDGLPLAIELAAARIKLLSPSALKERLEQSLKVLSSGRRDAAQRQRTLRGAIAWSYDLLAEEERILFRRLGVFAGGFTLEAAEEVCDREDLGIDVLDGLSSLVDKSLVRATEDQERFSMLETIREFALERLEESGEAEEIRRAHAEFFRALAEEAERHLQRESQKEWLDRLEQEFGNLRAVVDAYHHKDPDLTLSLSSSAFRLLWVRGHLEEGRHWLSEGLRRLPAPTVLRAKALRVLSVIADVLGDKQAAISATKESLAISRVLEDDAGTAASLGQLGTAEAKACRWDTALSLYEQAATLLRPMSSESDLAITLNNMGNVALNAGQQEKARTLFEESLEIQERHGNSEGVAFSLLNLGLLALDQQRCQTARSRVSRALEHASHLGHHELIASCLDALAAVSVAEGDPNEATRLLDKAADVRRRAGLSPDVEDEAFRLKVIKAIKAAVELQG
jgi:predicted ATPase/class 3 adenylate cyclase